MRVNFAVGRPGSKCNITVVFPNMKLRLCTSLVQSVVSYGSDTRAMRKFAESFAGVPHESTTAYPADHQVEQLTNDLRPISTTAALRCDSER